MLAGKSEVVGSRWYGSAQGHIILLLPHERPQRDQRVYGGMSMTALIGIVISNDSASHRGAIAHPLWRASP